MENHRTLIACEIFRHELELVLSSRPDINVHWLDAALHANADRMKTELEEAVTATQVGHPGDIQFLFGNGCHPDICQMAEDCGAQLPGVNNCI